ncbi:MAG: MBL fold metallo-hydrolase [Anaerolineae bacterium]
MGAIIEVGDDVLVGTGYYGANVGCILTYDGAVLVDAPIIPSEGKAWRQAVEEQMGAELIYMFITDSHPNHAIGNGIFNVPCIANERAYRSMARFTPTMRERVLDMFRDWAPEIATELADFQVASPEITFDYDLTIYRGGRVFQMLRLGGHTPASSVLFVQDARVLFAGDLIVNGLPPFVGQGDSLEWLQALQRMREMQPRSIVPGHGPVAGIEIVDKLEGFLLRLRSGVASLANEGRSKAEVATRMLYLLDEFDIEERWRKRIEKSFRASIARVYEEMSPEIRAEPEE